MRDSEDSIDEKQQDQARKVVHHQKSAYQKHQSEKWELPPIEASRQRRKMEERAYEQSNRNQNEDSSIIDEESNESNN